MINSIFVPIVKSLTENKVNYINAGSFQKYIKSNNLGKVKTAEKISIDSYEKLDSYLKDKKYMVFRLGKADIGRGTAFALSRFDKKDEYFLIDEDIFDSKYIDYRISEDELLPFRIIDKLTEVSFLNIALNSGIVSDALGVKGNIYSANTHSTYTFRFKLNRDDSLIVEHNKGQVEIDSVFANDRDGGKVIFVIEAKSDIYHKSLSKHKLVYPVLAIADRVPPEYKIIPVYIKIFKDENYIYYNIAECNLADPRENIVSIDSLVVKHSKCYRVKY